MWQAMRRPLSAVLLIFGSICALLGTFIGYASSATGTYGWLLRLWAGWSIGATALLMASIWIGPQWVRIAGLLAIALILTAGIDPASRLALIGWNAP
jgi:hypothetical protein